MFTSKILYKIDIQNNPYFLLVCKNDYLMSLLCTELGIAKFTFLGETFKTFSDFLTSFVIVVFVFSPFLDLKFEKKHIQIVHEGVSIFPK